jgi:nucleotide-binding universal stress UspA family protein
MIGFKKILCPIDLSSCSALALRYAAHLARWSGAEMVGIAVSPAEPPEAFAQAATGGTVGRLMVTRGDVVAEILRAARELPADVIVMGTHGWSGLHRLLVGSVTEGVVRQAQCPVLTVSRIARVPAEADGLTFKTIVCGVDRSTSSDRALAYALSLARQGGGRLVVVHALENLAAEGPRFASHFNQLECWRTVEPEIRAAYESLIPPEARQSCDIEVRIPFGDASGHLLEIARHTEADLLVVGTGGWQAPYGRTTQHALRAADCPVLAVPAGTSDRASDAGGHGAVPAASTVI